MKAKLESYADKQCLTLQPIRRITSQQMQICGSPNPNVTQISKQSIPPRSPKKNDPMGPPTSLQVVSPLLNLAAATMWNYPLGGRGSYI